MAQGREIPTPARTESDLYFGPFRLEQAKRLWRGNQLLGVRPQPLAVLRYLAGRQGQLVTGEELLEQLWPGIYVTKTVLRVCVRELRQALGEDRATPQFIETVGRQGYRFIGTVSAQLSALSAQPVDFGFSPSTSNIRPFTLSTQYSTPYFVGREHELARLHETVARARRGERQVVFLLGEAGIGKTTLVDRFLQQVQASGHVRIGRGQCIEHYGPGEAYFPLLEALGQVCEGSDGEPVVGILRRYAPLWLAQLPGLVEADEQEAVHRQVQGSGRERMLREFAEAVEALAADSILVLVLEDLQWSDASTLEALAYLARRRRPVQLYILGTYRPADVVVREHPLRQIVQELYGRRLCEELALELFTEAEVEEYLHQRFAQSAAVTELSHLIYQRTDGNALFMVNFVDSLLQQELLGETDGQVQLERDSLTLNTLVPATLQQAILRQIERLPVDEQQLLRVASVAGMTFTAAEVAGVVGRPLEDVEEVYDRLATWEQLIAVVGIVEWPDGTVTVRYEFRHALYQQVLYEQIGEARRIRLHRQVGAWKEGRYGTRAAEIASELAAHFTAGRDYRRAVQCHGQAGETALRRSAYREASTHCKKGLVLLERLPDTPERQRQELTLLMTLGVTLIATRGYAASEIEQTFRRARTLCDQVDEAPQRCSVLYGLWHYYGMRAELQTASGLAEQFLDVAQRANEPALLTYAHWCMGVSLYFGGALRRAHEHLAQIPALYDPDQHYPLLLCYGQDVRVTALALGSEVLWLLGYPDQARSGVAEALAFAYQLGSTFSQTYAVADTAYVFQLCQDVRRAQERADAAFALAAEHGFPHFANWGEILRGWALAAQGRGKEGVSLIRQGLGAFATSGTRLGRPHQLALLADAHRRLGQAEDGLTVVAEALAHVHETGEHFSAAELYGLKGELLLAQDTRRQGPKGKKGRGPHVQGREAEAEDCFLWSLEIARQQEAKSLELRAAMSLSRLWQHQGKSAAARTLLAEIYGWFTEGFDTQDLLEARALLDALGG